MVRSAIIPAFLCALLLAPALAGGRLQTPLTAKTFASPAACAAELESLIAQDSKAIFPKQVMPDGTTREVNLKTEGMQKLAGDRLRYEAMLWFHHGKPRPDLNQIEISHSFEKVIRECEGTVLMIHGEKGFTLATFEPLGK